MFWEIIREAGKAAQGSSLGVAGVLLPPTAQRVKLRQAMNLQIAHATRPAAALLQISRGTSSFD